MTEVVPLTNAPLPVRLTVDDYLMLDEAGAFAAYGKTELLDGEIVYMNAQHRPHARIKSRFFRLLADALDDRALDLEAIVEGSIKVPPHNVPEPDIVVTDAPDGYGLIPAESVRLLVEVSDATLATDMTRKAGIYARAGFAEYWVVDVNDRVIHQLWDPDASGYVERRTIEFGDAIDAVTISGLTVATDGL